MSEKKSGLELLREPFPANQISKLPKPTKKQTEDVRSDYKKGIRCTICGAWHHPDVIHLDYVGHAALTDRLLDADPAWYWEPLSIDSGLPVLDQNGGMWIRLTVCGVTRLGYGHAGDKSGGDAIKEVIGDALRNAAMRFGAALDLWHKGDLHATEEEPAKPQKAPKPDSAKSVSQDVFDNMPAEEQQFLKDFAMNVYALLDEDKNYEAYKLIADSKLDADEKVAINALFNPKQRRAMKDAVEQQKEPA